MAFTNETIIRKHLSEFRRPSGTVENYQIKMIGDSSLELPHKGILSDSELVKGRDTFEPEYESVVLSESPVSLGHQQIVTESAVVAKDQSLTEIYRENSDYLIDCASGTIQRLDSGEIENGQTVSVWYFFYRIYNRNSDYAISYTSGMINRFPDGAIEDGQTVWIDYEIESAAFSDEMVTRALEEAHAVVCGRIAPEYQESSDSSLEVGETYIAISILCRMYALEVLQSEYVGSSQKSAIGQDYLALGQSYHEEADRLLIKFQNRSGALSGPLKVRNKS